MADTNPGPGPQDPDVEALVAAATVNVRCAERLRISANADPASPRSKQWNACVTAAERSLALLCQTLAPARPDLDVILRSLIAGGDKAEAARIACNAIRGSRPTA